ncbi:efflux RND transporter periplasmic adaptor subunit [Oscillatoria laete-virens NRMC-F 0139]|nr:efflux RND transporter periplasmic adaptor subunit [Oscillatoria laete-virens]MDL5054116.1 efflux RND transporter periplasmic adaptor subunit [Oscillatoria laete-virens NRMC-F 0139]
MFGNRRIILVLAITALMAGLTGYFAGRGSQANSGSTASDAKSSINKKSVWTCSMHPQVRLSGPGKCPICEMPLIPADSSGGDGKALSLKLSDHARAMASVETAEVKRLPLSREIRATGKIQYNESTLATITARVDGYVERLYVDYTGISVEKGNHLVDVYSPELVVAQHELLLARNSKNADLIESAKIKLLRWEVTQKQIDEILTSGKTQERLTIFSPVKGTVVEKLVVEKNAVKAGDVLYRLANLDTVWVYLDVYEYEIGLVQYGQNLEISTEAYSGEIFKGRVTFISPVLDDASRTIRVRASIDNPGQRLKPGMFANTRIRVSLMENGKPAPTGVEGLFACPMHPEVIQDKAGKCRICEMDLVKVPGARTTATTLIRYICPMHPEVVKPEPGICEKCGGMKLEKEEIRTDTVLAVPAEAVLDSGTRTLVYVEKSKGEFFPAVVKLGTRAGDYFPVLSGLRPGDRVAVRGNFLIDSQFQIRGSPSLLYPEGSMGGGGHDHGNPSSKPDTKSPVQEDHSKHAPPTDSKPLPKEVDHSQHTAPKQAPAHSNHTPGGK